MKRYFSVLLVICMVTLAGCDVTSDAQARLEAKNFALETEVMRLELELDKVKYALDQAGIDVPVALPRLTPTPEPEYIAEVDDPEQTPENSETIDPNATPEPLEPIIFEATYDKPARMNQKVNTTTVDFGNQFSAGITFLGALRGADAYSEVAASGAIREIPTGYEYLVALFSIVVTDVPSGGEIWFDNFEFKAVDENRLQYPDSMILLDPYFSSMIKNDEITAKLVFVIRQNENVMVVWQKGGKECWFDLSAFLPV